MIAYLDDGWIYKRLEAADKIVFLRKYRQEDGILLVKLFYETIHSINTKNYAEEQVSAWATGKIDLERVHAKESKIIANKINPAKTISSLS